MFTAYWRQRLAVPERPLLDDKPTDWVDSDVRDVREPPLLGKQRDQLRAYVAAFEQAAAAYRRSKQRVIDASQDTERAVERATTLRTVIVLENRTFTTETGAPRPACRRWPSRTSRPSSRRTSPTAGRCGCCCSTG